MTKSDATPVSIRVDDERTVSGLLIRPKGARAVYVLAHGAGAGMKHPFLAKFASLLSERGIATLRYQFPYMEAGSRRPDSPKLAEATVRAPAASPSVAV
jgi:predicted alpha/beta-hydrolase family hydrolase